MKALVALALILIVGGAIWYVRSDTNQSSQSDTAAPASLAVELGNFGSINSLGLVLPHQSGEGERALADLPHNITMINTWATWCPFCVHELPDFAAIGRDNPDVEVIAINRGEERDTVTRYLAEHQLERGITWLTDERDAFYSLVGGFAMPETLFVSQQGIIVAHKRGPLSLEETNRILDAIRQGDY